MLYYHTKVISMGLFVIDTYTTCVLNEKGYVCVILYVVVFTTMHAWLL